jgi:micrococcal nuclease
MPTLSSLLFLLSLICLVIGLIKPSSFNKVLKRTITRKSILKIFGSATVIFFIIFAITVPPAEHKPTTNNTQAERDQINGDTIQDSKEIATSTEEEIIENEDDVIEDESNQDQQTINIEEKQNDSQETILSPEQGDDSQVFYAVTKVTDGDTFKVDINGTIETIRLVGIDTPETVDPRKTVQCFGIEASNRAKELLIGKKVRLESDQASGDRGIYGRLLRYAWLEDGTFFNKKMILDGYASEYTYKVPYKYQTEFKQAETEARNAKRGLWADDACVDTSEPILENNQTTNTPATQSGGKYYTSSYYSSKFYYPEPCDGWQSLSEKYLESYDSLEALLQVYPTKTLSPQCQ